MRAGDSDWKHPLTLVPWAEEPIGVPCKSMVKNKLLMCGSVINTIF